jgi:hypothetical protein
MKALMIGACLAVLSAPALALPYDQDQTDPYYDQGPPQPPAQPPPQGGYQGDEQNGYSQYQPPYDQGNGDEDDNADQADQGYGGYQPPPAPPPGQPGFQNYQGAPQDDYGGYGGYEPGYGQSQPHYGYPGGYEPHQYGYQGGNADQRYGGAARYTGRTSGSWRNGEGQSCVWREMTWQDQYGRPAYRWTPHCR